MAQKMLRMVILDPAIEARHSNARASAGFKLAASGMSALPAARLASPAGQVRRTVATPDDPDSARPVVRPLAANAKMNPCSGHVTGWDSVPPDQLTLEHAHDLTARLMQVVGNEIGLPLDRSQAQKITAQLFGHASWDELQMLIAQKPVRAGATKHAARRAAKAIVAACASLKLVSQYARMNTVVLLRARGPEGLLDPD